MRGREPGIPSFTHVFVTLVEHHRSKPQDKLALKRKSRQAQPTMSLEPVTFRCNKHTEFTANMCGPSAKKHSMNDGCPTSWIRLITGRGGDIDMR